MLFSPAKESRAGTTAGVSWFATTSILDSAVFHIDIARTQYPFILIT